MSPVAVFAIASADTLCCSRERRRERNSAISALNRNETIQGRVHIAACRFRSSLLPRGPTLDRASHSRAWRSSNWGRRPRWGWENVICNMASMAVRMPVVHLDLYIIKDKRPIEWRTGDLERLIEARLNNGGRPLVVEGILLLQALNPIRRTPSKLFFVELEGTGGSYSLANELSNYIDQYRPQKSAYILKWAYSNK